MDITNAQYVKDFYEDTVSAVRAEVDGVECFIPIDENNRHYDELMRLVDAGELTIAPAE